MWASHDDQWKTPYVATLAECLLESPDAVLATPAVFHIREDGTLCSEPPDRPATGESALDNLEVALPRPRGHLDLRPVAHRLAAQARSRVPDVSLLGSRRAVAGRYLPASPVVGDQEAVIFKRLRRSSYAPRTARAAVAMWGYMFWHLSRIALRRTHGFAERAQMLALSWRYVYHLCIRRPHLLRTAWRVVRMLTLAGVTAVGVLLARVARRVAVAFAPALDSAVRRPV